MKTLKAYCIKGIVESAEKFSSILDIPEKHSLEFHLWEKTVIRPEVSFSIAHNDHSILLKFFVQEEEIRASVNKINGPVWEDSCVEFFVSFDESGYYNLEFNCLGTVCAAFGKSRNGRTPLPEQALNKIKSQARITRRQEHFYWEISLVIPTEVFIHHSISSPGGIKCRGNFYKCGDGLSSPHFLSWTNIESNVPNFHLPDFFGEIVFEDFCCRDK